MDKDTLLIKAADELREYMFDEWSCSNSRFSFEEWASKFRSDTVYLIKELKNAAGIA